MILCSRTDPENATASINAATGRSNAQFLKLDLSSLKLIREFAANYTSKGYPPIKALLLNAGLQFPGDVKYSPDDIEMTFAVNHVGHALLFYLLRPHLAKDCHILITSSGTHDPLQKTGLPAPVYNTAEELAHPTAETAKFSGRHRYSTSKLCNVMWMYALNKRVTETASESSWTVNAVDPGFVPATGLARDAGPVIQFLAWVVLANIIPVLRLLISPNIYTPQESGAAMARLAMDGSMESGKYCESNKVIKSSELSYDVSKQEDLWKWTVDKIALSEEEKQDFNKVY